MKNLKLRHLAGVLAVSLLAASCQKEKTEVNNVSKPETPEVCTFGLKSFSMSKRPETDILAMASKRKNPGGGSGGTTDGGGSTPPSSTSSAVIYLDFDGQTVSNTYWNGGATINARYSGMTAAEIDATIARVQEDYSPFNVTVTANESVYNAADPYKRVRVIITETWEWYTQTGGVAYMGSFTWGDGTPAFVFSSLLYYNSKYVAEAASHEAGHTLGLYHQASYENGVKTADYNPGTGSGETSWAPIMGMGYYNNLTLWHNGLNANGQNQDDLGIITRTLPYKNDDFGNSTSTAAPLGGTQTGLINTNGDVDVFYHDGAISSLSLRSNANVDLKYTIYDSNGQAIASGNDVNLLGATASMSLAYGRYYIAVTTVANNNTTTYGMVGTYTLSVQ